MPIIVSSVMKVAFLTVLTVSRFRDKFSFSITTQPTLTLFGPHIDHGGHSQACNTWPWPHFQSTDIVKFT